MIFVILTRRSPRHAWVHRADVKVPPNDISLLVGKYVEAHRVLDDVKSEVIAIRALSADDYGIPRTGDRGPLKPHVEKMVVIRVEGTSITKGRGYDPSRDSAFGGGA